MATNTPIIFDPVKASEDFRLHIYLKAFTTLWFLGVLLACAYALLGTRNEWWPWMDLNIASSDTEKQIMYAFVGGVIGATLFAFHGFCVAAGPQDYTKRTFHYDPNYTWWYIAWPPIGGFAGLVAYAVVKTGIATLGTTSTDATSNLGYFAVAALAGLSSRDALTWLSSKSKGMFPSTTADPAADSALHTP